MGIRAREAYFDKSNETDSNDSDHEGINPYDFYMKTLKVENEIMDLYEHEFGYDPREPNTISFYTEEETIERHAQNIVCWRKLLAEYDVKEPNDIHKVKSNIRWQYITNKADETALTFYLKFKHIEGVNKRLGKRVSELMNEFNEINKENNDIKQFIKSYTYPSYEEVINLIRGNVAMCAEYGELNHKWMEKMYNDIFDKSKVKVIGKLINKRGGMTAMDENFSTFMKVVRNLLKRVQGKTNEELNIIQCNIYNEINTAWDNIGSWRM